MQAEPSLPLSSGALFELIEDRAQGLFFDFLGSEGEFPLEAVLLETRLEPPLTEEKLYTGLDLDPELPTERLASVRDARLVMDQLVDVHRRFDLGDRAEAVVQAMRDNLTDLTVMVIGEDYHPDVPAEHPVYVLGLAADGRLVGFRTAVIWT